MGLWDKAKKWANDNIVEPAKKLLGMDSDKEEDQPKVEEKPEKEDKPKSEEKPEVEEMPEAEEIPEVEEAPEVEEKPVAEEIPAAAQMPEVNFKVETPKMSDSVFSSLMNGVTSLCSSFDNILNSCLSRVGNLFNFGSSSSSASTTESSFNLESPFSFTTANTYQTSPLVESLANKWYELSSGKTTLDSSAYTNPYSSYNTFNSLKIF